MNEKTSMTTDEAQKYLALFAEEKFESPSATIREYIHCVLAADFVREMAQALQKIRIKAEVDKLDAARYRWFRRQWSERRDIRRWEPRYSQKMEDGSTLFRGVCSEGEIDESIDLAMRENECSA